MTRGFFIHLYFFVGHAQEQYARDREAIRSVY